MSNSSKTELKYADMLHMPHYTSPTRPRMSMHNRAAQFSPFAALSGYDDAVKESARLTDRLLELDDYTRSILDDKLRLLVEHSEEQPMVTLTYFEPDQTKSGGAYMSVSGIIHAIDAYRQIVVMENHIEIPIQQICEIESAWLAKRGFE